MSRPEKIICMFCDCAADDRPGLPLCVACWAKCEKQAAEQARKPVVVTLPADSGEQLTRYQAQLVSTGQSELAAFVRVSVLAGVPPGTKLN
jgi:hypothetical protein